MIERLENFKQPVALAVIGTLGLTACSNEANPATPEPTPTQQVTSSESGFTRTAKYFDDGSRVLSIKGQLQNDAHGSFSTDILQFCDGKDLVETALIPWRSGMSTSISRSALNQACADGKLTPSDFPAK